MADARPNPPRWRPALPAPFAPLLVAVYLVAFCNTSLWAHLTAPAEGATNAGLIGLVALVLAAQVTLALQLVNTRYTFRPAAILLLLIAALASYAIGHLGVPVDVEIVESVLGTDLRESAGFVSPSLAWHLLGYWVLPSAVLLWLRIRWSPTWRTYGRGMLVAGGLAMLVLLCVGLDFKSASLWSREHRHARVYAVPSYAVFAFAKVVHAAAAARSPVRPTVIAADAHRATSAGDPQGRPLLVVLVVGEAARAMSFSLNGYPRQTNPELQQRGVISFTDVTSCGTATAISLPCMFSMRGREHFDPAAADSEENLLDVLERAGVRVTWSDNDSGCKGVCDRVSRLPAKAPPEGPACPVTGCHDDVLVAALRSWLADSSAAGDRLLVLHMLGSHGPDYNARVPASFRHFQPACTGSDVAACPREAIVNAYDNSIRYTDHVLATMIDEMARAGSRARVALLYVSDHGESLGEHGVYLHGMPYVLAPREQTHVPLLIWHHANFGAAQALAPGCLHARRTQPTSHDALYHTILGIFGVRTHTLDATLDLLAACRRAETH